VTKKSGPFSSVRRRAPAIYRPRAALARIQHDKKVLEVESILRAHGGAEDK
jgi:hypothetical protein